MDDDGERHYEAAQKYGVGVYPSRDVLDAGGKVAFYGTEFNEKQLRAALAKLGVN